MKYTTAVSAATPNRRSPQRVRSTTRTHRASQPPARNATQQQSRRARPVDAPVIHRLERYDERVAPARSRRKEESAPLRTKKPTHRPRSGDELVMHRVERFEEKVAPSRSIRKEEIARIKMQQSPRRPRPIDESVMHRLDRIEERLAPARSKRREEAEKEERLVAALAMRSYHLPDHSCCGDWLQYLQNNHPLFGLCFHYRLHPIKKGLRILFLLGSILFGLALTNIMWLVFYYNGQDYDAPAIRINLSGFADIASRNATAVSSNEQYPPLDSSSSAATSMDEDEIEITNWMLVLWTVGGGLHAIFDNTVWYLSACICCLSRKPLFTKFQKCATYCLVLLILTLTGVATLAVLLRTTLEQEAFESNAIDEIGTTSFEAFAATEPSAMLTEEVKKIRIFHFKTYEYLVSYVAEFFLALFVYYPLVGSFFFSGIMGCGKIPLLGGRPYEVEVEKRQAMQRARNQGL